MKFGLFSFACFIFIIDICKLLCVYVKSAQLNEDLKMMVVVVVMVGVTRTTTTTMMMMMMMRLMTSALLMNAI